MALTTMRRTLMAGLVAATLLTACGGGETADVEAVSVATLAAGDSVPRPSGEPVLTLTGAITELNDGASLELDVDTIERLGLVRANIYEPFEERTISFTGVDMADVLALADPSDDAHQVHMRALDDYEVTFTTDEVRAGGMILATQADGEYLDVVDGGPVRIVFLEDTPAGENADRWIWSVADITVHE